MTQASVDVGVEYGKKPGAFLWHSADGIAHYGFERDDSLEYAQAVAEVAARRALRGDTDPRLIA